ncbi:MAG TPA: hypothetical protein VFC29_11800, partial [Candidatus Limnocylindrales bacterium]|nr:hypothetical protein [Candidatus Limnocylindrales bacterium]
HHLRHNQQADRAQQPVQQQTHFVPFAARSEIVFFARTMLTALVHQQVPLDEGNSREIIPRGRATAPAVPPDPRCDKLMAEVVDDA